MNALFALSTAEQPATHEWADAMPERSVYAPDWLEGVRVLWVWTTFEHAIEYLKLFEPIDDLTPPLPFDPRADWGAPFLWATGGLVSGYQPLTGWQSRADGIYIKACH